MLPANTVLNVVSKFIILTFILVRLGFLFHSFRLVVGL